MNPKDHQKSAHRWKKWITPTVSSAVVFVVLITTSTFSPFSAIVLGVLIAATGVALLRLI